MLKELLVGILQSLLVWGALGTAAYFMLREVGLRSNTPWDGVS